MTSLRSRHIVLVHGLYADGSSWSPVIALLQQAGAQVTSVQNPLTSLADSVRETARVIAQQPGPTVLAGHSFAGTIISEAGVAPQVTALVYVAARAPDAGEDHPALAKTYPPSPASAGIVFDGDQGQLSEEAFLRDFAGDLPEAQARVLCAVQQPFTKALAAEKTSHAAWHSKPSFYAVATQDRAVHPDLQRFLAQRMKAHTIEVAASHAAMLSQPQEIADLILLAARSH